MTDQLRDELLTMQELADYLKVSKGALYQMRYRGFAPPGVKIAGKLRFRESAVIKWLDENAEHVA
jgi:excisionase family DNA binding protein